MSIAMITGGREQALGIVSTASTTVAISITTNLTNPTGGSEVLHFQCQAITLQAISSNTGVVYICNTAAPTLSGTMDGVLWEVPPPSTTPVTRPMFTIGIPSSLDPLDAAAYYLVPAVSGEGLRCTAIL